MTARFENKVLTPEQCLERLSLGSSAKPVVFTNGVFDILHRVLPQPVDNMHDVLVVGVNSDASARRLGKGPDRPLNNEHDRAALLAAMACVSFVIVFDEDTPVELIRSLRPDIIVKGGDYDMRSLPETALVESWGGRAVAIPFEFARSTTALVTKIRQT